jgi:hypothetical protein
MNVGLIATMFLGGLLIASLFFILRQTKNLARLEKEAEYAAKETEILSEQLAILADRDTKPVSERLSEGSF